MEWQIANNICWGWLKHYNRTKMKYIIICAIAIPVAIFVWVLLIRFIKELFKN